tara:strand:- start:298 stop:489 length:192 start_codon:yes stop_codon:yes gene_type:complete
MRFKHLSNKKNISCMNKKFSSNNVGNEDFATNTEKSDYTNLIIKLKQISETIALLEKQYLDKF